MCVNELILSFLLFIQSEYIIDILIINFSNFFIGALS